MTVATIGDGVRGGNHRGGGPAGQGVAVNSSSSVVAEVGDAVDDEAAALALSELAGTQGQV